MPTITIEPATHHKTKLYKATIPLQEGPVEVYFGNRYYAQYPIHKDVTRKENYIKRHQKRENWNLSGITTPGFWSRWLLWNQPTIEDSIDDIKKRFNVDIKLIA